MYITELHYINVGPIERVDITLIKDTDIKPHPVIFVGKNGSGKSILLSNIVDCFYEVAGIDFQNVIQYRSDGGRLYYKIVTQQQIKLGKDEMFSHIKFKQDTDLYEYIYKRSQLKKEQYIEKYGITVAENLSWGSESDKKVNVQKGKASDLFDKGVVCYFAPSRFTKPVWLGDQYVNPQYQENYSVRSYYRGTLRNPIENACETKDLLQWIFDVLSDSKPDIEHGEAGYKISYPELNILELLRISKYNLESVFSTILGEDISLRMLNRSMGESRLSIERKSDKSLVVPSLDSLSTGQLALLNIFGTIIRYADVENLTESLALHQIKGVVVIDEIELHLHAELQYEVLPKLIKLFPLVQFIITSHSPLFLLGMQEEFGDDGFDIYEMPDAQKISVEQFSQFKSAYRYLKDTKKYQEEIRDAVNSRTEKTLIITEGATDWRHMKAAMAALSADPDYTWLGAPDFEFLAYDPKNSTAVNPIKLEMGWPALQEICSSFSKVHQQRKIIVVADCDDKDERKVFTGEPYKNWGNNVYSLCLPVPESRANTPAICIEHYYTNEEIRREVEINGIIRRIYMGYEFERHGVGTEIGKYCEKRDSCGPNKIDIIDGGGKAKVIDLATMDENCNFALSKMDFAEMVLNKEPPFDHMDFSNFKVLFTVIKEVIDLPLE